METRKFQLAEVKGKLHSEKLFAEIKAKTGLDDSEIGIAIHEGGTVAKTLVRIEPDPTPENPGRTKRVTYETIETIEPRIDLTLSDPSKFGKAFEAIQAHAPEKDDAEHVAEKAVHDFNEKLASTPVIQKILAALEELKKK